MQLILLFSRNKVLGSQSFQTVGGMEDKIILGYGEIGINFSTLVFVFDHSSLSCSVGNHVQRIISKLRGFDVCSRNSLFICLTIQGMAFFFFPELDRDCIGFVKKWRAIVQFQNARKKPRLTDRAASSLVKLFISKVTTWVDDMNTVEKVIDALLQKEDEVEGKLVNEVKHVVASQKKLQRGEVVQYRAVASVSD